MVKPDAYSAAQELGQAIDRAAAAEQEVYELKIALEDAQGSVNRLSMQLAEAREEVAQLRAMVASRRGGAA